MGKDVANDEEAGERNGFRGETWEITELRVGKAIEWKRIEREEEVK